MIVQPHDGRRFFMLPQAPEDAGYYVYGKLQGAPSHGASQFAHPSMMTTILRIEREWQRLDHRKFGVGDISLANGVDHPDHRSHQSGLEVDIRPIRKDGLRQPVTWRDSQYDRDATAKLVRLFHEYGFASAIYFNDASIPFTSRMAHHDNHFHVELRG